MCRGACETQCPNAVEEPMKTAASVLVVELLLCVMAPAGMLAQATAQVSGTVRDVSGAVLPGVQITATQTDTGNSRMTVTNESGFYVLPSLPLGPYKLEGALLGFRTF